MTEFRLGNKYFLTSKSTTNTSTQYNKTTSYLDLRLFAYELRQSIGVQ